MKTYPCPSNVEMQLRTWRPVSESGVHSIEMNTCSIDTNVNGMLQVLVGSIAFLQFYSFKKIQPKWVVSVHHGSCQILPKLNSRLATINCWQATPRIWGTCEPVPKPLDGNPLPLWKTGNCLRRISASMSQILIKNWDLFLGTQLMQNI